MPNTHVGVVAQCVGPQSRASDVKKGRAVFRRALRFGPSLHCSSHAVLYKREGGSMPMLLVDVDRLNHINGNVRPRLRRSGAEQSQPQHSVSGQGLRRERSLWRRDASLSRPDTDDCCVNDSATDFAQRCAIRLELRFVRFVTQRHDLSCSPRPASRSSD